MPTAKKKNEHLQKDLIVSFFRKNPNRDVKHPEVVDFAVEAYRKATGKVFRDPDRAIRRLSQSGFLVKVAKGVYRYEPERVEKRKLYDFSSLQKKKILERDGFRCVLCGRGLKEGVDLHIDHIRAKDLGGEATIENGQTLCSQHNFFKKNLGQTEAGKKMFIRLYQLAKSEKNEPLMKFCKDILGTYEQHNIDTHISWKK